MYWSNGPYSGHDNYCSIVVYKFSLHSVVETLGILFCVFFLLLLWRKLAQLPDPRTIDIEQDRHREQCNTQERQQAHRPRNAQVMEHGGREPIITVSICQELSVDLQTLTWETQRQPNYGRRCWPQ